MTNTTVSFVVNKKKITLKINPLTRVKIYYNKPINEKININEIEKHLNKLIFSTFTFKNHEKKNYFLVKDLAKLWNFSSSYQLIDDILKNTNRSFDSIFCRTTQDINKLLIKKGILKFDEKQISFFYMDVQFLFQIMKNVNILFNLCVDDYVENKENSSNDNSEILNKNKSKKNKNILDFIQKFNQTCNREFMNLKFDNETFNSLSSLNRFKFCKKNKNDFDLPTFKLSNLQSELCIIKYDYFNNSSQYDELDLKKKSMLLKKVDSELNNFKSIDTLIIGQGFTHQFDIDNFYDNISSFNNDKNAIFKSSNKLLNKNLKDEKTNQNNDSELNNFKNKNIMLKSDDNYKVASKSNKKPINPAFKVYKKVRHKSLKNLIDVKINNDIINYYFNSYLNKTSLNEEEIQIDNKFFNKILNKYRMISDKTLKMYYAFKLTDFDQLAFLKLEKKYIDDETGFKSNQITEIEQNNHLPNQNINNSVEFNDKNKFSSVFTNSFNSYAHNLSIKKSLNRLYNDIKSDSSNCNIHMSEKLNDAYVIKKPIYNYILYPNSETNEFLTKFELIKIPNANSIGWDNFIK